jgi:hypothetical protein
VISTYSTAPPSAHAPVKRAGWRACEVIANRCDSRRNVLGSVFSYVYLLGRLPVVIPSISLRRY